jgi:hypothetical protein
MIKQLNFVGAALLLSAIFVAAGEAPKKEEAPKIVPAAEERKKIPVDAAFPFDKGGRAPAGKPAEYVWVSDLDGANARRLCQGYLPHWAPNGKAVAYTFAQVYGRAHKAAGGKPSGTPLRDGCNGEISPDGKWITWVVDTAGNFGGWLGYAPFAPGDPKAKGQDLNLGVDKDSVNYFPDFSPDSKYLVYVHAEQQKGVKSWTLTSHQDLYVCRFPADGVSVRITWTNAACQHLNWRNVAAK